MSDTRDEHSAPPDDPRLREAFDALRAQDTRRAPDFHAMIAKKPAPRMRAIYPVAASFALAAGVFALWCQDASRATAPASSAPAEVAAAPPPVAEDAPEARVASPAPVAEPPRARTGGRDDVAPLDFLLAAPAGALLAESSSSLDFLLPKERSR